MIDFHTVYEAARQGPSPVRALSVRRTRHWRTTSWRSRSSGCGRPRRDPDRDDQGVSARDRPEPLSDLAAPRRATAAARRARHGRRSRAESIDARLIQREELARVRACWRRCPKSIDRRCCCARSRACPTRTSRACSDITVAAAKVKVHRARFARRPDLPEHSKEKSLIMKVTRDVVTDLLPSMSRRGQRGHAGAHRRVHEDRSRIRAPGAGGPHAARAGAAADRARP